MLEVLISILRNGACVVKDLLPPTHALLTPSAAYFSLHQHLDPVPLIDLFIAPLQLAAVFYGGVGGLLDLGQALARWRRARAWAAGAQSLESKVYRRELLEMRGRLNGEVWRAWGAVTDALVKLCFGGCFLFFFLSTLQQLEDTPVQWTLLVMELAALVALYKGLSSILEKRAKALWLLAVEPDDLLYNAGGHARLVDYADKRLLFTWENGVAYHPNALFADVEHLGRAFARLEDMVAKAKTEHAADAVADLKEVLHRVHTDGRQLLSQCWLDALVLWMDFIAFLAYIFFPLVWFYPDEALYHHYIGPVYPGHGPVLSAGALVGDVMWTLQPFCYLGSAVIRKVIEDKVVGEVPKFALKLPVLKKKKAVATATATAKVLETAVKRRTSTTAAAAKEEKENMANGKNETAAAGAGGKKKKGAKSKLVAAAASLATRTTRSTRSSSAAAAAAAKGSKAS